MTKIRNLNAYIRQCVHNSIVNEYRQNDNAAKHVSPAGLHIDQQAGLQDPNDEIELAISYKSPENWLLFIESPNLHRALSSLSKQDLELLFLLFVFGHTQQEVAKITGVSQAAINKRYCRIKKIMKKYF